MSRRLGRTCSDCETGITDESKTGRCRACALRASHADPEWTARKLDRWREVCTTPEALERRGERSRKRWEDPEQRERMSSAMRAAYSDPVKRAKLTAAARDNLRRWHANTDRDWSAHHRARSMRTVPWCPADRYDELLAMSKKVGRAEAERMMRDDIEARERARWAAMTPFERQMERVAAGAQLIEVRPMRRADHGYTLGGVAPEAM